MEEYRPYRKQIEFHTAGARFRERLLMAGNQLGKALRSDEPVLTPQGWRAIGSLAIGDKVIAGDGSITSVTGVYPQGEVDLYRLRFDQGAEVVCCADHLWQVTLPAHRFEMRVSHGVKEPNPGYGRSSVVSTRDLVQRYRDGEASPKQRVTMPHVGVVKFQKSPVSVDPYLLGVLLGDGCLRSGTVTFTTADDEIVAYVKEALPEGLDLVQAGEYGWRIRSLVEHRIAANGQFVARHALKVQLGLLGVYGKLAHEKSVPSVYLWNEPAVRLRLLQGLMDTDGSVGANGTIEYCSTSKQLADDVAFLVRSFGGKARITPRITTFTGSDGGKRNGRVSYRVWIRCPHVEPVRLTRKRANLIRPTSTCDAHVLHSIEPAGRAEAVCITVAHDSRLFVTRDFIVTHNSLAGGAEYAYHATGRYPTWWQGRVFDKPTVGWVAGVTGELTRDGPQRILCGRSGQLGTGMLPKDAIVEWNYKARPVKALDSIIVRHGGGGDVQADRSVIQFKSYDQGREKFQAETLHLVWLDEEPPADIYTEALTRTNTTNGIGFMTFTPLQGMSEVVGRFLLEHSPDRHVTQMTIDDVEHYSDEQKKRVIDSYPAHEREARANGVPIMGSGRIFPVEESIIKVEPFQIPSHWARLVGLDFGWTHPTAAAWIAWDRDTDTLYVYDCYRVKEQPVAVHANAILARGKWIPVAWPHDGENETAVGPQLAVQYRDAGCNMLEERAHYVIHNEHDDTVSSSVSVEAGLQDMLTRMQRGQLRVFSHLNDWFEEFRLYHRDEGKVVKERDDLMSATRYGVMMLRFAETEPTRNVSLRGRAPANWKAR